MLKKIVLIVFVLISGITLAQEGTSSPYSFYGIGLQKFKGTVENRSMGGISMLSDSIHLNIQNPAGVADLKLINFTIGGSHKSTNQKTSNESQKSTSTSLDYIAVGIPMGKFGASFGLIPFSSVGYKINALEDGSSSTFEGSGGLNKAFLTLAYKITPKFNIGVDANYNFGEIDNTSFSVSQNTELGVVSSNSSALSGFSFNLGAMYKTMITENLELSSALSYSPGTNFKSTNNRNISTVRVLPGGGITSLDSRDIDVDNTEFTFPSQYTIGTGIGQPKNWFVGVEYTDQKTSNFTNRNFQADNIKYSDASKFKLGGFYIPNYNSFGNFAKRIVYRAGIRFEETGLNIDGEDINEFGISFGVGLPVTRLFSNINLGIELGQRGTKNAGLVQENFFNTFLSLSLNDKWFEKRYIN